MSRITLEQASTLMCSEVRRLDTEEIEIYDAVGRVLAKDLVAALTQPPFPRAAMDGYAVRAKETKEASKEHPVRLVVEGKLCAGDTPLELRQEKSAIRIMTGAMIPYGADCVIRQEDTDYGENEVELYVPGSEKMNISPAGEDFTEGEVLVKAGSVIDAYTVSIAAANGRKHLTVYRKLKVAVISSGDELCLPGTTLKPGKIYDSNKAYMVSRCKQLGYEIVMAETIGDKEQELKDAIRRAIDSADFIITTGGVSVGQKDLIPKIVSEWTDTEVLFHGVSIKPGMPTLFARMEGKAFLGLSGNPYSASAIFELLGVPATRAMQGRQEYLHPLRTAAFIEGFTKKRPCPRILRGFYNGVSVHAAKMQRNGQIKAGIGSNCLLELPAGDEEIKPLACVKIYLI